MSSSPRVRILFCSYMNALVTTFVVINVLCGCGSGLRKLRYKIIRHITSNMLREVTFVQRETVHNVVRRIVLLQRIFFRSEVRRVEY